MCVTHFKLLIMAACSPEQGNLNLWCDGWSAFALFVKWLIFVFIGCRRGCLGILKPSLFYVCMTASSCSFSVLQRPIKRNVLWAHGSICCLSTAPSTAPFRRPLFFLRLSAVRRTEVCYNFLWAAHKQKSCFLIPVCVIWRAQKLTMSGGRRGKGGWVADWIRWLKGGGVVAAGKLRNDCAATTIDACGCSYPCELITFEQRQGPLCIWIWMWMWMCRWL